MGSESGSNSELANALEVLGSKRIHELGNIAMSKDYGGLEVHAGTFNFSVVAMALDGLRGGIERRPGLFGPESWIYTARNMIEAESKSSSASYVLMESAFFVEDPRFLRSLNRWVSSRIPSGLYEPEEFANDVLSGRISMMNPRNN